MAITSIYAALTALVFVVLSGRVILMRQGARISLGDGGDLEMQRRIRAQGNCAEYAPFALLLIGMAEMQGVPGGMIHVLGAMLLVGRCLHGYALSQPTPFMPGRVGGMVLTIVVILVAAAANLVAGLT